MEGARWGPTFLFRSKSSSSCLTGDSWRKVGKVLVLEKRKGGKLEFSEHATEVRWGYGKRKEKIKIGEKVWRKFRTTWTGQLRGNPYSQEC